MKTIQCPCGQPLSIPDTHAGKAVRCPACQRTLRVPSASVPSPAPARPRVSPPTAQASIDTLDGLRAKQAHRAFEHRTRLAGIILGLGLLITAGVPVSVRPVVFLWQVPAPLWVLVCLFAQWGVGLVTVVMSLACHGWVRGAGYVALGLVLMAASPAVVLVLPSAMVEASHWPLWIRLSIWSGMVGACLLLWIEHVRLHVQPQLILRIFEASAGGLTMLGFGALTVKLVLLMAGAGDEVLISFGDSAFGANPKPLLVCGMVVVGFMALGGMAAVLDAVIPHRGRRQSLAVLTPIYFAMVALSGLLLLLGGKLFGGIGVLVGVHVTVLVLMRPLLTAYGFAAIAANVRHRQALTTLEAHSTGR